MILKLWERSVACPEKLAELRSNYAAFRELLPVLLAAHRGEYALLRHGDVIGFYDTLRAALVAGRDAYADDLYSVQEVTDRKADLGWYSRVPIDHPV